VRDKNNNRKKIAGLGLPGKSAYEYAVDGGFAGTEAEFAALQGGVSNQNLLHNAYWAHRDAIINQRGQTEYTTVGYSIDRWALDGVNFNFKLTINDGYIALQQGTWFSQFIEKPKVFLSGEKITASIFLADSTILTLTTVCTPEDSYVDAPWGMFGTYFDADVNAWRFRFADLKSDYHVVAAKLELGPIQTLAHKDADGNWVLNDPPPDKALELAKCQRYYVNLNRSPSMEYSVNISPGSQFMWFHITTPVEMRAMPAIRFNNILTTDYVNGNKVVSNMTVEGYSASGINVRVTFDGMAAGTVYKMYGGSIEFDANL